MSGNTKGLVAEECLRAYFLDIGYYVVRGIYFQYKGENVTDIDLWLYNKNSLLTRERINVDVKDKKRPQATERLLWAKGIQKILEFDSCIVATSDKRQVLREFGQEFDIKILDGNFLSRIKEREFPNRFTEEEFAQEVSPNTTPKSIKSWYGRLLQSKARLLNGLDFSGANATLDDVKYFLECTITAKSRQEQAFRCLYLSLSHLLLILDFVQQKTLFLEENKRKIALDNGLRYGELGREGIESYIDIAAQITNSQPSKKAIKLELFETYDHMPIETISDYFNKPEVIKNLFNNAKVLENLAFSKTFKPLSQIGGELLGIVFVFADYFNIDRLKLPV